MNKISLASRVAIAFIRPYRSYLDGYILIKESKDDIEKNIRTKMDTFAENAKRTNPEADENKIDYARDCMIAINVQMLDVFDPSYTKVLPSVIEDLTVALENELKKNFTEQELEEILEAIDKPSMQKLLANTILFGLLKKYEAEIEYRLRMKIFEDTLSGQNLIKMKKMLRELKKNHRIDDSDESSNEESDFGSEY